MLKEKVGEKTARRQQQGARLERARRDAKYDTALEAANANGWPVSTYYAHERGSRPINPEMAEQYARVFSARGARVTKWSLLDGDNAPHSLAAPASAISAPMNAPGGRANPGEIEGERVEIDAVPAEPPELRQFVQDTLRAGRRELWCVTTDKLDSLIAPGDFVIVDLDRRPQPGNTVLAIADGKPIFRGYFPPSLVVSTRGPHMSDPALVVDNVTVTIRGVLVAKARTF